MVRSRLAMVTTVLVVMAACGGEATGQADAESEPAANESAETTPPTSESEPGPTNNASTGGGSGGTITVDGEAFPVNEIFRCAPRLGSDGELHPDDLDVIAYADDSRVLTVTVYAGERVDMNTGETYSGQRQTVRLNVTDANGLFEFESDASNDVEGNWTTNSASPIMLDAPPFSVDGGAVAGALSLAQTFPEDQSRIVEVDFDLEIPTELLSCYDE